MDMDWVLLSAGSESVLTEEEDSWFNGVTSSAAESRKPTGVELDVDWVLLSAGSESVLTDEEESGFDDVTSSAAES